ncbi:MAG: (4Fe-4S)-binding protein [Bacteroidota bacterium]
METTANVYSNGEITVTYNPKKCINAEFCAKQMSNVFRQSVIPWINLDGASSEDVMKQVKKCPSGALQCYKNQKVA